MFSGSWTKWKRFAHRTAEIQSFAILTLLYWLIVVPIGFATRRRPSMEAAWNIRRSSGPVTVEDVRRQS